MYAGKAVRLICVLYTAVKVSKIKCDAATCYQGVKKQRAYTTIHISVTAMQCQCQFVNKFPATLTMLIRCLKYKGSFRGRMSASLPYTNVQNGYSHSATCCYVACQAKRFSLTHWLPFFLFPTWRFYS